MSAVVIFIAVLFAIGVILGAYAFFAPKAKEDASAALRDEPPRDPAAASERSWTDEAAGEFAGLNESARCDFIFAIGALEDPGAHRLLLDALGDPSPAVALAAAHVLARGGQMAEVRAYAEKHAGERSAELLQLLSIMT